MKQTSLVDFEHLAESSEFAEFSRLTRKLTGLRFALNDPAHTRLKTAHEPTDISPLCQLIHSVGGKPQCDRCDMEHFQKALKAGRGLIYRCHAGLIDMAIPIFVEGRHVATITCGQILPEPHSENGLRAFWNQNRRRGLKFADVRKAYASALYLPRGKVEAVLQLLTFFASHLYEIGRRLQEKAQAGRRPEITRALEFVRAHFREYISRDDVARHVNLSPSYFGDFFRRETGVSFTDHLQQVRVQEARKLLEKSQIPVTTVAFDCGFGSLSQFNRSFKALAGRTPRQSRKNPGQNPR